MFKLRLLFRFTSPSLAAFSALLFLLIGLTAIETLAETLPVTVIRPAADLDAVLVAASTPDSRPEWFFDSGANAPVAHGRGRSTFVSSKRARPNALSSQIDAADESHWPIVALLGLLGVGAAMTAGGVFLFGPLAGARSNRGQMMLRSFGEHRVFTN